LELKPYKRIVTAGSWDILNVGHIFLLQKAKELCDCLIVLVSTDELIYENKGIPPVVPFKERLEIMNQLQCIDMVWAQWSLVDIEQFKSFDADMFVLGDDWEKRDDVPGIKWLKEHNRIIFFPYTSEVSSSIIKERIINNAEAILEAQRTRKRDK
jgi:glycerol-3-phosphate cytidylyltransferase